MASIADLYVSIGVVTGALQFRETSRKAGEDWGKLWPVAHTRLDQLEEHVAAIMKEHDHTMEGLIIKAQALAEWNKVKGVNCVAFRHGQDWHGQIAASILRHAKGDAA